MFALVLAPSEALAAWPTVIGSATGLYPCAGDENLIQTASPVGTSYAVPAGGAFITSWSTLAGAYTGPVGLQVWRRVNSSTYLLVGASPEMTLTTGITNTFPLTTPIPVQANDLLGMRIGVSTSPDAALCIQPVAGGAFSFVKGPAPAVGTSGTGLIWSASPGWQLDVSATVDTTTTPGPGTGCDSSANANATDACAQTQTLILRLFAAAVRASRV
jgi:hypothetical protein